MAQRIVIIHPDGREELWTQTALPNLAEMQKIVGGYIELVRVLRQDIEDRNEYTNIIVNDEGLLNGLPRNQRATDLYLANVRRQFPDHPEPWQAAADEDRKKWESAGAAYIDFTPEAYRGKEPVIAGTVIWFSGYTCDELIEMGL
jgi:hypothetical protein